MKIHLLIIFLLGLLFTGCTATPPLQPPDPVAAARTLAVHKGSDGIIQPTGPAGTAFPLFQYWPGIETNWSQLQSSTDLVTWSNWPQLYYGAPDGTNGLMITTYQAQQFFRMVKVN